MSINVHYKQTGMLMLGKSKFVFKPHGNEFCLEQCMGRTDS
jgi:hypothetical protein